MEDNDNKQREETSLPPTPPGATKPGSPRPPQLPPASSFAQPRGFSAPNAPQQFQRDASAEETARMNMEKDRLEKKIAEMEKIVSQEKEKTLLATLKNQQDEALSSKVETSLRDIQDKLRRDRREQEVQEERLTLKSKVKDLETRLVSERETWMQTLKGQIQERETQSKDVEGHFIYRLQEMERRWLEEKAQWQKSISQKEDEVRALKSSAEKLREAEDELRRAAMEKEMQARDISKLRDEVARIDREKASIESYIKNIPEREREFSDMRAENANLRARGESARSESKLVEEKFRFEMDKMGKEVGRLQSEIGAISDRKNAERDEELRKLQTRYEFALQEKEKAVADITGEKVRAMSELIKMKGFISRVQAINAVLEKERQSLRLEKMQMAQAMAANIEDAKKIKSEIETVKVSHQAEISGLMKRYQDEIQKFKNDYAAEFGSGHAQQLADLQRAHQDELAAIGKKNQDELAKVKIAAASGLESNIMDMRAKYEAAANDIRAGVKRELEQEYACELARLKAARAQAEDDKVVLEVALKRSAEESRGFDEKLARVRKEYEDFKAPMVENYKRLEAQADSLKAAKADYERRFAAADGDRVRLGAEVSRLTTEYSSVKAHLGAALAAKLSREAELSRILQDFKTEKENRARFESELLSLKQTAQQLELQLQDAARQIETEKQNSALSRDEVSRAAQADQARIDAVAAELEKYRQMESSFSGRMKWALKGKKEGE